MSNDDKEVVSLKEHKLKQEKEKISLNYSSDNEHDYEEAIDLALMQINNTVENDDIKGFIGIMFSANGEPEVIHAGYLDLVKAVGTIEFIKNEMMNHVQQPNMELLEELGFEFDPETSE